MDDLADLEISLHRHGAEMYSIEARFSQPESDADIRLGQAQPVLAQFDLDALRALADPAAYGQALTQSLFADPAMRDIFVQACASAQTQQAPLRLRLFIGPTAPELHALYWETLRHPQDDSPLSTNENILFSRYLSSTDWRPVRLRPKGKLEAIVVIANPANLSDYNLAAVDVAGELERARASLGAIPVTTLPTKGNGATLNNLAACLRDERHDILYLGCHSVFARGEPWLWLEDNAGNAARVSGNELVARMQELRQRPRLIVLASCQSAGSGQGNVLAALGPRLAEIGIPAVLAMQGYVTAATIAKLLPIFFEELQRDGQIDRALAAARGAVRNQPDYWMPALFTRLKSGRIWYVPGFGRQEEFEKWPALGRHIKKKECTPLIGHGLNEPLFGSLRDIARRWAETYRYPLEPHEQEDLPQVAQYLAVKQNPKFAREEFGEYLRQELQRRYAFALPDHLKQDELWSPDQLLAAIESAAAQLWGNDPAAPHKVLAELRLPIYITACADNLLANALTLAGAQPQIRLCPWNKWILKKQDLWLYEDDPTPLKPLVYHLFGHLCEPRSLVLTEDDYFDYLIGVTANKKSIPEVVRAAMTSTALVFVGFRMNDRDFRALLRILVAQEGGEQRKEYSHAAAQIEPEESRLADIRAARRYLEEYFKKSEEISLYWGSADEFLKELRQHLP